MDYNEKSRKYAKIMIFGKFCLLLKWGATETALARGESLEQIGKHMINDIEIGYRGVNFSVWGSRVFHLFLENYDGSSELRCIWKK